MERNDMLRQYLAALPVLTFVAFTTPALAAYDRHVLLVNNSNQTIVEFHASQVGHGTWEEDILGRDVLRPGEQVRIDIDDGTGACHFDFLTVMADHQHIQRHDVNVCVLETYM
jgi:hypothetical protein